MNYIEIEAGVGVLLTRTLRDRDVEKEATGKYSCRVLVSNTAAAAPLRCQHETSGSETTETYFCHVLIGITATAAPACLGEVPNERLVPYATDLRDLR